jgi:nucleoid DNA-binding protein
MSAKRLTKAQVIAEIAEAAELDKKSVSRVFDGLTELIKKELRKPNAEFVIPGLLKLRAIKKPATKDRPGVNPFTKQPITIKGKPAKKKVRATASQGPQSHPVERLLRFCGRVAPAVYLLRLSMFIALSRKAVRSARPLFPEDCANGAQRSVSSTSPRPGPRSPESDRRKNVSPDSWYSASFAPRSRWRPNYPRR